MDSSESNLILGTIGALVGSLLGVFAIVALGQIGYVAVVSGIVMGFGTFVGYAKLGGGMDLKGIIISVLIMIVMIYVANRINWALFIIKVVPNISFSKAFSGLGTVIKQSSEVASKYYQSLVTDYIFCAIGAFYFVKQGYRE